MKRTCFFHAGCPDGFGAAWSVWRAWGERGSYVPRGHDDALDPSAHFDADVVFVDIAPPVHLVAELADAAARLVVLDHHVSAQQRYATTPAAAGVGADPDHVVHFDLDHSGAILAWSHFHPHEPPPELLRYVEDQDLWRWKLPHSEAVNACLGSYPRDFDTWDALAARPIDELAEEGAHIARANRLEVERSLQGARVVTVGSDLAEAVNASNHRAQIGHELAKRAMCGLPWGVVYRVTGDRVDVSLYSVGELDVSRVAERYGGGGHRNAAGFGVELHRWLEEFVTR